MRPGALDVLVLLVTGGAGIVGALCWPDYTTFAVSGSVALMVLFTRC
jgi:hypothetical protein